MYTRGRKKAEAEPAPPARDPRDVETIERLQQRLQELELQQLQRDSPVEEADTEPNVWDDEPVDVNPFGGRKHRYVNRLYHPRHNDRVVDHDDRYREDPIRNMGLKIEIPEFTGKVHLDDFINWLSTVERVFDKRDIPDKLKVKLVAIKLRQHTLLWWDHVTKRRRIEGKLKVETWEKMKKLMKAKFLPENHQVINEFDKLLMRCDVVEEEEQVVARFLEVLKPEIAYIVSLQPYWTYTDVCRLALKVKKQIKAKTKGNTSHFTPPTRTDPPTAPKATTPTSSAACNTRERANNAPRCYKCSGVYARDCPNLKTLAFVPDDTDPIYDTDAAPKLDELGNEFVYPDRGEAFVIQRVLNVAISKSVNDNSWLHNNIFRTKCTSKGKVCDNYRWGQLRECLSIGKNYKDEVWCEVIPMDAAHILLRCPWQFDRKTKHDGFQNTYSFKKDGVNITLVPFYSRQTQGEGSNLFMKKTDFVGLVKTSPYVFTLVVVEENEIISEAPLQV
ncbi:hypothetical protein Tco_1277732 [Tanacetum coccineum]